MFRRTFSVTYSSTKNNNVLLPDSYFRLISTYVNGCVQLSFNDVDHYISWAPHGGGMRDSEIGINASVAQAIGLNEGITVKCSLITDVRLLKSLDVTPLTRKDWEMLELSSNRIQSTLLDQTRIVNKNQKLIVWINKSMHITIKVDFLNPAMPFGKIENDTEINISPFNSNNILPPSELSKRIQNTAITKSETMKNLNGTTSPLASSLLKNDLKSSKSMKNIVFQQTESIKHKNNHVNELLSVLDKESIRSYEFRVLKKQCNKLQQSQVCDLYIPKDNIPTNFDLNQIYELQTMNDDQYYVNVRALPSSSTSPTKNIYPTIEVPSILIQLLELKLYERITLKPKKQVFTNIVEKIDLIPRSKILPRVQKEIEQSFKKFVVNNTKIFPILLNQDQIMYVDDVYISVKLYPDSLRYCLINSEILRENLIFCVEEFKNIDSFIQNSNNTVEVAKEEDSFLYLEIEKISEIIDKTVECLKLCLCLDDRRTVRRMENFLFVGSSNCGKSTMCNKITGILGNAPHHCYIEVFSCSKNKGRKPESIQRDLRHIFSQCMRFSPSILVLDNLDILAHHTAEHTQDGEYYNKVSDVIKSLIEEFTKNNPISVIATVSNLSNLNRRIYSSRGHHLFNYIINLPNLDKTDRERIIFDLCTHSKFSLDKQINWTKFANLTEGYSIGNIIQFVDRTIFYALKENSLSPVITNKILNDSLEVTNSYCLEGIENISNKHESDSNEIPGDKIPGLELVINVFEEVIMWPTRFSQIFENSPLRNQAGILLFGPPGTGKTFLVSQLSKTWNLRMISVKGPELLAKYIGQSEENVRNLFDKARSAKPCVLFFDEFDSLAPRRGHDSTGVTDRVVNQLLTELDGVEGLTGVTVIGATSRPELLDPALLRSGRMDRLIECTLPDKNARFEIFKYLSNSLNLDEDVNLQFFAEKTQNFTGADIQSILTTANMMAVEECLEADSENVPDKIIIRQKHLLNAFSTTRPSLSAQDVAKYKDKYARFTNKEMPTKDFVAKRATLA